MIWIDQHEPRMIQTELTRRGIPVTRKQLKVGDYRFGEYCIERKTVTDFLGSIYQRRMYDQLYNLQQAEKPVLIVVGDIPPTKRWMRRRGNVYPVDLIYEEMKKRYKTIRVNMIQAYTSYNVQVFHALDEDDFVDHLCDLYVKSTKKGESLRPLKRKSKSTKNVKIDIFGAIPNIGPKLATYLAKGFTVRQVFNMKAKNLVKIKDIGPKTARKIVEVATK